MVPSGSDGQATINDIARLAGVSKKTVSRVINRSPLVRDDTREKVEALIREHHYAPDPMARGLAFRKSFLIGMVYDNPNAEYVVQMQNGALDSLRGSSFELVVHPCDSRNADYIDGVRAFAVQQRLHGVILVPRVSEDQALVDMLREVGCRYVRIGALELDDAAHMITTNDREGAVDVAKYLESLGHRHIGLITGPQRYLSARERGGGFVETLRRRGVRISRQATSPRAATRSNPASPAPSACWRSARGRRRFSRCNDEMAAGVYKAAYRLGLRIPEQLSVVGFDDSPIASRLWPSLTTVRLPIRDMGLRAAALLLHDPSEAAESGHVHPASGRARVLPAAAIAGMRGRGRDNDTGFQSAAPRRYHEPCPTVHSPDPIRRRARIARARRSPVSAEPTQRAIARRLYAAVRDLPIISPHGHTDPAWFADERAVRRRRPSLLLAPDHYLYRMLYSQGVPLEALGVPSRDGRRAGRSARGLAAVRRALPPVPRHAVGAVARPRRSPRCSASTSRSTPATADRYFDRDRRGAGDAGVPAARAVRALQHRSARDDRVAARPRSMHHQAIRASGWSGPRGHRLSPRSGGRSGARAASRQRSRGSAS